MTARLVYDILEPCPILTNGGLHDWFSFEHTDHGEMWHPICHRCHAYGHFTDWEMNVYLVQVDLRFAAANRRRKPKDGDC
jgi:hypothetical protein